MVEVDGGRRKYLIELFRTFGYKIGAEIGVYTGNYSAHLCRNMPDLKLYSIDAWKQYEERVEYSQVGTQGQDIFDRIHKKAKDILAPYNCEIIHKDSLEAAKDFKDESLDFVYIDANHKYKHVTADIAAWEPKVKIGGAVAGHDYMTTVSVDVEEAVLDWTKAHNIKPWYVLTGEKIPSWYWIKWK